MKQAGMKITYAGVDITQWMYVQMVKRDVGTTHVNTMQKVGISDGQMLQYMSRDVKTIVVTGIVMNDNLVPLRRSLAAAIDMDEPQRLIFGDEPDKYYLTIVDSQPTFTEGFRSGTISISFVCPDGGIAHSVATKTFDNMPYKDVPVNLLTGTSKQVVQANAWNMQVADIKYDKSLGSALCASVMINNADHASDLERGSARIVLETLDQSGKILATANGNEVSYDANGLSWCSISINDDTANVKAIIFTNNMNQNAFYSCLKIERGTTASPWSPNPADPEYYADTITVHNGGTYPVEPVITATMHADNGFLGFANSQGGVLQFGNPEEIDGYTSEESEVALNLAAVQGSHMDNQAASNNLYWGDNPATPNEQIGNAIWTQDSYDGWKVEPNWPSITGDHKYWNGPSIKHNLAQTHNGNFKSNLTWDVMTRFQTGVSKVGSLETTLESDGKPIFQMILKDNSALSDQIWWMCYYKNQLVVNEQLDRNIFTNDKFIQLELQKFGNSVVFRVSPWVGNRGRETTITRQFTFADAASVETKQFSAWFMRDKTWGESTMYLIASTVKWQNVSWYTDIKNRFSNGDVITIDVANTKTYFNGNEDRTLHTLGNQWDKFLLPPGDTIIQLMPSSWAQPFMCEVDLKEAWM
ncbi:distal tail protein Dit [Lacticaseibacillus rhamnosus]|uniref:distal tail protein Dit n=2 Tax=Lacticaseibacillus rhamnosus TaxID=47715 RepID=UPI0028168D78|nr:distal tail protein Dit [Lacticaseibacillus rhamnosus]